MKAGDMVKRKPWINVEYGPTQRARAIGIILETGVYVGRKDLKVTWSDGKISTINSGYVEVISESR